MTRLTALLNRHVVPALTALSENTYMSAIRAGMVSVVPLTIIGGLFLIISYLPVPGWTRLVEPWLPLLQIPVTATFGILGLVACLAIAYDLGARFRQEAVVSAIMAVTVFLLIQIEPADLTFRTPGLGSQGLFTAIIVALVVVRVQKLFTDRGIVITMPETVPSVVYQSFLSLVPLLFLVVAFWLIRFVVGVDINHVVQSAFGPLVFALNTLPGILVYAFLVSLLWSVGIHGDNALDAIVAPIFLQYLAENVAAMTQRAAAAVRHRQRLLHDLRQRRRHRRHARPRPHPRPFDGPRLPPGRPRLAADADVPDQRADLLRAADRAQPGLHGAVRAECADPDRRAATCSCRGASSTDPSSTCRGRRRRSSATTW